MDGACPDEGALGAWWEGTADDAACGAVEAHLDRCDACLDRVSLLSSWEGADVARPPLRIARPLAAAALLVAGLGIAVGLRSTAGRIHPVLDGIVRDVATGRENSVGAGDLIEPSGRCEAAFPDGTRLAMEPRSRARILAPGAGERLRLSFESGAGRIDAAREPGEVVVATPIGEVRVVGTKFRLSLLESPLPPGGRPVLLEVHVEEGRVAIAGSRPGGLLLAAGETGYVLDRGGTIRQIPVPESPAWSGRILDDLRDALSDGAPPRAALALAALRRQGTTGVTAAADRARRSATPDDRDLWQGVLEALGTDEARDALRDLRPDGATGDREGIR